MAQSPSQRASETTVDDLSKQIATLKSDIASLGKTLQDLGRTKRDDAVSSAQDAVNRGLTEAEARARLGRDKAEDFIHRAEDYAAREPATAVGVAAAVGFVLGFLVSRR